MHVYIMHVCICVSIYICVFTYTMCAYIHSVCMYVCVCVYIYKMCADVCVCVIADFLSFPISSKSIFSAKKQVHASHFSPRASNRPPFRSRRLEGFTGGLSPLFPFLFTAGGCQWSPWGVRLQEEAQSARGLNAFLQLHLDHLALS